MSGGEEHTTDVVGDIVDLGRTSLCRTTINANAGRTARQMTFSRFEGANVVPVEERVFSAQVLSSSAHSRDPS